MNAAVSITIAVAFFSAISDQWGTFELAGATVRVGQLLLMAMACLLCFSGRAGPASSVSFWKWPALLTLALSILGAMKAEPGLSATKELWLAANLGLATVLALSPQARRPVLLAFAGVALVILIDSYLNLVFDSSWTIGHFQSSYPVGGRPFFRPHAFHYEPSYAGSALALAGLVVWSGAQAGSRVVPLFTATAWSAAALTTSRTAIGALFLALALDFGRSIWERTVLLFLKDWGRLAACMAVLLGPLLLSAGGSRIASYFLGRMSMGPTLARIEARDPRYASENNRIDLAEADLTNWKENPWVGHGIRASSQASETPLLSAPAKSTGVWMELLVEKGLIGAVLSLAMIFILLARVHRPFPGTLLLPLAIQMGFIWFFVQTLPRLDFWIALFVLGNSANGSQPAPSEVRHPTNAQL